MNIARLQEAIEYLKRDEVQLGAVHYYRKDGKTPCCAVGHLAALAGDDSSLTCGVFAQEHYGLSCDQVNTIIAINDAATDEARKPRVIAHLESLVQAAL